MEAWGACVWGGGRCVCVGGVRSFVLLLTRNNGTEPEKCARGNRKLFQGNTRGFSLLLSRLCTLRPPASSALAAKRRLHRTKGALVCVGGMKEHRTGSGGGDGACGMLNLIQRVISESHPNHISSWSRL